MGKQYWGLSEKNLVGMVKERKSLTEKTGSGGYYDVWTSSHQGDCHGSLVGVPAKWVARRRRPGEQQNLEFFFFLKF